MAPGPMHAQAQVDLPRPEAVDLHVRRRIRERRINLGLTQQQMAVLVGVTHQQAQKYEAGISRISAGRLFALAKALGVDVANFFDGMNHQRSFESMPHHSAFLELTRDFASMTEIHQKAVSRFARAMAEHKPALVYSIDDGPLREAETC